MKHYERWFKWWLAGAAFLALCILVTPLVVREVNEYRIDRRVDQWMPLIEKHAKSRELPVELVRSIVRAESAGRPDAVSPVGARGLMQLMPDALEDMQRSRRFDVGKGDLFDPDYNLSVGTAYLRHLLDRFEGDPHLALAAYHMGPTKVRRHLNANPKLTGPQLVEKYGGPQTRAYVKTVMAHAKPRSGS